MATTVRLLRHSIFSTLHHPPTTSAIDRGGPWIYRLAAGFHRTAEASSASSSAAEEEVLASSPPRRHNPVGKQQNHDFSKPCGFLGSWDPPSNPKEAEARLDRLRKDYRKQMKQVRRECAYDVEMLRIEKQRKDDARREADRIANKERKAAKAAAAKTRAEERKAFQEQFRLTLLKERAEKLESWRAKEELREKKKNEKKELLRQQSSMWIAEENLEDRVSAAFVDTTPL